MAEHEKASKFSLVRRTPALCVKLGEGRKDRVIRANLAAAGDGGKWS